MIRLIAATIVVTLMAASGESKPPIYLETTSPQRAAELRDVPWIETLEREVPKLRNAPEKRLPMIMWHGVGFDPLTPAQIEILRQRGLCQHLQLSETMIESAKALARAKMPIILMEGRTDNWPYSLAPSPTEWAHQFDATYEQPWFGQEDATQWHGACPHKVAGWSILESNTRKTLLKFRDAGVRVDAVLVDYEGDPYPWSHSFDQLKHCRRCRRELPPDVVQNKAAWRNYAWKQYVRLYDEHFAKPIREVFPDCLVTNWHVVFSSQADPVRYFVRDTKLPVLAPQHFSATNPIAYASDAVWQELWDPELPLTQRSVDQFFTKQIIQQVRSDKLNREALGKGQVKSIPWVSRVCRITGQSSTPSMSRESYRLALRQLWDLKIESMQIFNPMHDGYEELAILEVKDAVAAYDAMLSGD